MYVRTYLPRKKSSRGPPCSRARLSTYVRAYLRVVRRAAAAEASWSCCLFLLPVRTYVRACVRTYVRTLRIFLSPPSLLRPRSCGLESSRRSATTQMPWYGVVLRRWSKEDRTDWSFTATNEYCLPEFCVQCDTKRCDYELPKGGAKTTRPRRSIGCIDSSPFGTARCELWEETGVWLAWRGRFAYQWASPHGRILPGGPSADSSAWLCTDLSPWDQWDMERTLLWFSVSDFEKWSNREDHLRVLRAVGR